MCGTKCEMGRAEKEQKMIHTILRRRYGGRWFVSSDPWECRGQGEKASPRDINPCQLI